MLDENLAILKLAYLVLNNVLKRSSWYQRDCAGEIILPAIYPVGWKETAVTPAVELIRYEETTVTSAVELIKYEETTHA